MVKQGHPGALELMGVSAKFKLVVDEFKLKKKDIANMARISKSTKKEINITKEPEGKAKVNKGEYNNLVHKFKCKGCGVSF